MRPTHDTPTLRFIAHTPHPALPMHHPQIVSCIIVNTVVMAMQYFAQGDAYGSALEYCNYIFAVIFFVEAVVKMMALRLRYFDDNWNRFDFTMVAGSIAGIVFAVVGGGSGGGFINALRAFRLGRILRLMNGMPKVRVRV